jgi:hypothetical protein
MDTEVYTCWLNQKPVLQDAHHLNAQKTPQFIVVTV